MDKTMADKLVYIPKITPSVDYNQLKYFYTQLNETTNQNSLKTSLLYSQRLRKRSYNTLGTSVINSPSSPHSTNTFLYI